MYPYDSRVAGRIRMGVARHHHAVILLIDPPLGRDIGQLYETIGQCLVISGQRNGRMIELLDCLEISWFCVLALIDGRASAENKAFARHISYELTIHIVFQTLLRCDLSDLHAMDIPFIK